MKYLEIDGERWNYIYANPDGCLSENDRAHFVREIVKKDKEGRNKFKLKGSNYEAEVVCEKYGVIGCFGGMTYHANLETNFGKRKCSILVARAFNPEWN